MIVGVNVDVVGTTNIECSNHNSSKRNNTPYHQKNKNGKGLQNKPSKGHENKCYRCGMEGHWSHTHCTAKHLVNL